MKLGSREKLLAVLKSAIGGSCLRGLKQFSAVAVGRAQSSFLLAMDCSGCMPLFTISATFICMGRQGS